MQQERRGGCFQLTRERDSKTLYDNGQQAVEEPQLAIEQPAIYQVEPAQPKTRKSVFDQR